MNGKTSNLLKKRVFLFIVTLLDGLLTKTTQGKTVAIITNTNQLSPCVPAMPNKAKSLKNSVKQSLEFYFKQLDGTPPNDFYDLLMAQVEPPLLEVVLKHTNNNQSKAAKLLGISRGTLRKKLALYNLSQS